MDVKPGQKVKIAEDQEGAPVGATVEVKRIPEYGIIEYEWEGINYRATIDAIHIKRNRQQNTR